MAQRSGNDSLAVGKWVRLVVSLCLIAVVLSKVPLDSVAHTLSRVSLVPVVAAGALFAIVNCLVTYKWQLLLRAQGLALSYRQALTTYFVGLFFNNFLPTGFGGDAARAYLVARNTGSGLNAVVSVGFDRAHSLWALLLIAAPSCLYSVTALGLPLGLGIALTLLVVGSSVVGLVLVLGSSRIRTGLTLSHLPTGSRDNLLKLLYPFEKLGAHSGTLALSSLVALGSQMLGFVVQYLLFASLDVPIAFPSLITVISLVTLATILPVSVNGIGVREGAYVVLLSGAGVPAPVAVSLSLLSFAVLTANSLLGGILYALGK